MKFPFVWVKYLDFHMVHPNPNLSASQVFINFAWSCFINSSSFLINFLLEKELENEFLFLNFWGQSFTLNVSLQMNQLLWFLLFYFEAHFNIFFFFPRIHGAIPWWTLIIKVKYLFLMLFVEYISRINFQCITK